MAAVTKEHVDMAITTSEATTDLKLEKTLHEITRHNAAMEQRFNEMDLAFSEMNKSFIRMEARFDHMAMSVDKKLSSQKVWLLVLLFTWTSALLAAVGVMAERSIG